MTASAVTKLVVKTLKPHFKAYVIFGLTNDGQKIVTALLNNEADAETLNHMTAATRLAAPEKKK